MADCPNLSHVGTSRRGLRLIAAALLSLSAFNILSLSSLSPEQSRRLCSANPQESAALSGLGLFSNPAVFSIGRRFLSCDTYSYASDDMTFPPTDNPQGIADYATVLPSGDDNIAYVLTLASCPEDDTQSDLVRDSTPTGDVFYDAAAVFKQGVCSCSIENPESGATYNHTLYALVHPDAVNCDSTAGSGGRRLLGGQTQQNRITMLQDLGFWVKIFDDPLALDEIPSDTNDHLKNNVQNDAGLRDLMKLHAYRLTGHPLAVVLDFNTVMSEPMDALFDMMLSDTNKAVMYSTEATEEGVAGGGGLDGDVMIIKPDVDEYNAIKEAYKTTTYFPETGWGGSGEGRFNGGMGTKGFLKYFFKHVKGAAGAEEVDIKSTGKVTSFNPTCGKPWQCKYDDAWDADTKETCQKQNAEWYQYRYDFEQKWNKRPGIDLGRSTYHRESFLGYCTDDGDSGGYTGIIQSEAPTPAPTNAPTALGYGCSHADTSRFNICLDSYHAGTYTGDWVGDLTRAKEMWESVIVGDHPGFFDISHLGADYNCGHAPAQVDDLYICGMDDAIDGLGGVLGSAGPVMGSFVNGKLFVTAGRMKFDQEDIQYMMDKGTFAEVMKHEMGHIIGIGSIWNMPQLGHDLVDTSTHNFFYRTGNKACEKWRDVTGCSVGSAYECPPIEMDGGAGTAGGHWDEVIMPTELMSGYVGDGTSGLSVITVGALEDLGYTVDYSAADPYYLACPDSGRRVRHLGSLDGGRERRRLSEEGKAKATQYAHELLNEAHACKDEQQMLLEQDNKGIEVLFIADQFVSVLYMEDNALFSVEFHGDFDDL